MKPHPRLVMAGTHSGVGKTTATLSLLAALRKRGRRVQPFKAGPDFIDPSHHQSATGRPSRNLDGWMLGKDLNRSIFAHAAADADISIMRITGFTLGYRTIENARRCILGDVGVTVRGHEFHYSTLVARGPLHYTCALSDTEGRSKGQDGLMSGNVLALYTHLHFASQPTVAVSLVESTARTARQVDSRDRQRPEGN